MRVLLVDNYDSFTWNLVHALEALGARCEVVLADRIDPGSARARAPDAILISPGPGGPDEAGASLAIVRELGGTVPLLGVCLGMQVIAQAHGARVVRAPAPRHGQTSPVAHDGTSVFRSLPNPFEAMRYHSLAVDPASLPPQLRVTARADDGCVMGLAHATAPIAAVQFHPESFLSADGPRLLANWLEDVGTRGAAPR